MNGLGSYLLVYGELQPVVLVGSSAALMGRLETELAQKSPFWYCGCSSVSLGLNWRKSHWHIQESRRNAEKLLPPKSSRLLLRLTCIFSHVVGIFHVVYCDGKKYSSEYVMETCIRRYTNEIVFLLLSLTEFIQLAINISISYMAKKNIRSGKGRTSYMYFQTSGIYTSSLKRTVPRKVPIAKIWELMPLNKICMSKLGLKAIIFAKWYIQSKWKCVSVSVMLRYIHIYT